MTAQYYEKLIYDGEHTSMVDVPSIPVDNPRIIKLSDEERMQAYHRHQNTNRSSADFGAIEVACSGCWCSALLRGYIGTWEIKDGMFYLLDIKGKYRLDGHEPLFADWVTDALIIPRGRILFRTNGLLGSVYEKELHVRVNQGAITGKEIFDNRKKYRGSW